MSFMLRQAQHERNINRLHRSPWACRRVMLTFYETIIYCAVEKNHWGKDSFCIKMFNYFKYLDCNSILYYSSFNIRIKPSKRKNLPSIWKKVFLFALTARARSGRDDDRLGILEHRRMDENCKYIMYGHLISPMAYKGWKRAEGVQSIFRLYKSARGYGRLPTNAWRVWCTIWFGRSMSRVSFPAALAWQICVSQVSGHDGLGYEASSYCLRFLRLSSICDGGNDFWRYPQAVEDVVSRDLVGDKPENGCQCVGSATGSRLG